ncbi:MAG: hypothetical protein WCR21_08070 [Bacteroidota bacterium]
MKKLSLLVVLVMLVSSCGHKFSLQKRRYQKGFYFTAHTNKQPTNTQTVSLEKKKPRAQVASGTQTNDNINKVPLNNLQGLHENSVEVIQNDAKVTQFLKRQNSIKLVHPMRASHTNAVNNIRHKQIFLKHLNKKEGGDFLSTLFIGYIVIGLIALFISSVVTIGLAGTLLLLVGFILTILVLYAIGKLFKSMFGA